MGGLEDSSVLFALGVWNRSQAVQSNVTIWFER